jgi:hypothetical protein
LEHEDACDECSCKELRRERVHLMNNNNNNNKKKKKKKEKEKEKMMS